jgi:acyl dehydratase
MNTQTPDYLTATLPDHVGRDFGSSAPVLLDQSCIDQFAHCTGDKQWIHVDVERARAESPLSSTIVHGLLILSLIPAAHYELGVYPGDAASVLNYGFDRVRFLAPVPSGTAVTMKVEISEVETKQPGRFLVRCKNTAFSSDDRERPVMVAESLAMVMA